MKQTSHHIILYVFGALIFGLWLGLYTVGEIKPDASKDMRGQKIKQILQSIDEKYVHEVNADSLLDVALGGLLQSLDPHSSYLDAQTALAADEMIKGSFVGIGVEFLLLHDTATVLSVMPQSPASKAGLKPGMKLLAIDEVSVIDSETKSLSQIIQNIKGRENSKVALTFLEGNKKNTPQTYTLIRKPIAIQSISTYYITERKIAVIAIDRFSENTFKEFEKAFLELQAFKPKGMIIDLRNNPGGLLGEAGKIMNEFLEEGETIVYTVTRDLQKDYIKAKGNGRLKNMPLMVLINEGSASAAEIIAGAVQDNDRGIIAGRRSYGKGLVQEEINLRDGSKMRLTVAKYYTPSGRNIQKYAANDPTERFHQKIKSAFNATWEDSLTINSDSVYLTKKGRKIYGGGGIQPDYWIETTNQEYIQMHFGIGNSQEVEANLLKLGLAMLQRGDLLNEDEYAKNFKLEPSHVLELLGINDTAFLNEKNNKAQIEEASIYLKALLGKIIYQPNTFKRVMMEHDEWLEKSEAYFWEMIP